MQTTRRSFFAMAASALAAIKVGPRRAPDAPPRVYGEQGRMLEEVRIDAISLVPKRACDQFDAPCIFKFRDMHCGYDGGMSDCGKTFEACRERGNEARFGGFRGVR